MPWNVCVLEEIKETLKVCYEQPSSFAQQKMLSTSYCSVKRALTSLLQAVQGHREGGEEERLPPTFWVPPRFRPKLVLSLNDWTHILVLLLVAVVTWPLPVQSSRTTRGSSLVLKKTFLRLLKDGLFIISKYAWNFQNKTLHGCWVLPHWGMVVPKNTYKLCS